MVSGAPAAAFRCFRVEELLPQGPGFGLELDPDVIKQHDVDR